MKIIFQKGKNDIVFLYFERYLTVPECRIIPNKEGMKAFYHIMKQTGFSSIYVNILFTDAMKQISEYTDSNVDMVPVFRKIYCGKDTEEVTR